MQKERSLNLFIQFDNYILLQLHKLNIIYIILINNSLSRRSNFFPVLFTILRRQCEVARPNTLRSVAYLLMVTNCAGYFDDRKQRRMVPPSRLDEMALREFTACGAILLRVDHIVPSWRRWWLDCRVVV